MTTCPRELDVLDTIGAGRWPDGCEPELRAHAASCAHCAELVTVATAFHAEMLEATHEAPPPSSGLVWWRMQRRARQEAMRTATRTITIVQAATIAGAIVFALAILGGASVMSENWQTISRAIDFHSLYTQWSLPLLLALVTFVALAPFALYVAFAED